MCRENKDPDQLRGYRQAEQRLHFCICKMLFGLFKVYSHRLSRRLYSLVGVRNFLTQLILQGLSKGWIKCQGHHIKARCT